MPKKRRISSTTSSTTTTKALPPLSPQLYERVERLKTQFEESRGAPYRHVLIEDLCDASLAERMTEEVKALHATLKETDLFKVYQTGDLANIDESDVEHNARLKNLIDLRRVLNEDRFKQFIQEITGCGPLSATVDLSANAYARGGHLLCHDDVIGTRRVSYIVYLSDEDWREEDGGRLELYAADARTGLPLAEPCKRLLPKFNSMAVFIVEPGVSYHSVEEVFAELGKPRVSLQGWFHAAREPAGKEKATLQRLLSSSLERSLGDDDAGQIRRYANLREEELRARVSPADQLTSADLKELKEWVNPLFLSAASLKAIRERCETEEACVSLVHFLKPELEKALYDELRAVEEDVTANQSGWTMCGPAHLQRYMRLTASSSSSMTTTTSRKKLKGESAFQGSLRALLETRLRSPAFTRLLASVTCLAPISCRAEIRRFRRGSDYTVARAHAEGPTLDVTLCFVDDKAPGAADVWASGEVGGYHVYLDKEADGVGDVASSSSSSSKSAVYAQNEAPDGMVSIDPAFATLAIVFRDDTRLQFVKYVSKFAPSDRFDVSLTYAVDETEEEDDDDEEEEKE